jgi:multiubiquitin
MSVSDPPDIAPASAKHAVFTAWISDESFEFKEASFHDRKVTGAQIAEAAGAHPVRDFVVLQQLNTFELETLRPVELVDLTEPPRFFVIKGSGTDRFIVDGLNLEWPRKVITGQTIKCLVGKDTDDVELVLEREDKPDKVIDDDDEVRLGGPEVEIFKTRAVRVTIIVNTRERPWAKKKISFEELVAIAFPVPPAGQCIVYTVTFFDGPPHRPEGTLTEHESVKVVDRMVFSVKFTDKS